MLVRMYELAESQIQRARKGYKTSPVKSKDPSFCEPIKNPSQNVVKVVKIGGLERALPKIPERNVTKYGNFVKTNDYLRKQWSDNVLKTLDNTHTPTEINSHAIDSNLVK